MIKRDSVASLATILFLAFAFHITGVGTTEADAAKWRVSESQIYGNWVFLHFRDQIAKQHKYRAGIRDHNSVFGISCKRNESKTTKVVEADFRIPKSYSDIREVKVKYTIDDGDVYVSTWNIENDKIEQNNTKNVRSLARRIRFGSELIVSAIVNEQNEHRYYLSLDGAKEAINRVFRECRP